MTIEQFVPFFLRTHEVARNTKANYEVTLRVHVLPWLGEIPLEDLSRRQVVEWLTHRKDSGITPPTLRRMRIVLSAVMSEAVHHSYARTNPVRGVKTPRLAARKEIAVLTVEQFSEIMEALPTEGAQLLARMVAASGLRFGEVTALRPMDLVGDEVLVARANVEIPVGFRTDGRRFVVNEQTKTGGARRVLLDSVTAERFRSYVDGLNIASDQLVFRIDEVTSRQAVRPKSEANPDGAIGRHEWLNIWKRAVKKAGTPFVPTAYQLRHTHASWLIAGGADPLDVMERLGHTDLTVTSRYVHRVNTQERSASIIGALLQ